MIVYINTNVSTSTHFHGAAESFYFESNQGVSIPKYLSYLSESLTLSPVPSLVPFGDNFYMLQSRYKTRNVYII